MRLLNQKEIKEKMCLLLKEFDKTCINNNFTYYLAYGSLLGAIRHGGFIPWDDDLDVCMPRQDYNKFIDYCKKNNTSFKLLDRSTCKNYYYYYAKIVDPSTYVDEYYKKKLEELGIYIDIFPLDSLNIEDKKVYRTHKIIEKMHSLAAYSSNTKYWASKNFFKNVVKYLAYLISKLRSTKSWIELKENYVKKLQNKYGTGKQYLSGDGLINSSFFGTPQRIKFESIEINSPEYYDKYLSFFYKDNYMELPPKELQINKHYYEAYEK